MKYLPYYLPLTLILVLFSGCGTSEDSPTQQVLTTNEVSVSQPDLSPSYQQWVDDGKPQQENTPIPYLPRVTDNVITAAALRAATLSTSFPSKFDLRDPNSDNNTTDSYITDVRDQGQCGTCWAFAGMAAVEGSYGKKPSFDFSENNLKHEHAYAGDDLCGGGMTISTGVYLSGHKGVVYEAQDPYFATDNTKSCPDCESVQYIDNTSWYFARSQDGVLDINLIKDLLVNDLKPVQISFEVGFGTAGEQGTSVYDPVTKSFYQKDQPRPNHAVVIVGYDDDKVVQGQTGVFIVKNSWGLSSTTDNGYLYIPYTDTSIATGLIATYTDLPEDEFSFDTLYAHDDFGMLNYFLVESTKVYGANIYTTTNEEAVVGINTLNYDTDSSFEFEIHIMNDTLPQWGDSKTLLGTRILANQTPMGFHTTIVNQEITIPPNTQFAVLTQFNTADQNSVIVPVESEHELAPLHTSNKGESYLSGDGQNWQDISADNNVNLFIKVMTKNVITENTPPNVIVTTSKDTYELLETVTFTAIASDIDGQIVSYQWDLGSDLPQGEASLNSSIDATYSTSGIHTIVCNVTDDNGATSSYTTTITVNEKPLPTFTTVTWQDDIAVTTVIKPWLTDANYQTCVDNINPYGVGGDDPSCHDTTGDTAATYCADLSLDGYTDWRLPTSEELIEAKDNNYTNSIVTSFWSSSELETVASSAYMVTEGSDSVSWNGKDAQYHIRCIR